MKISRYLVQRYKGIRYPSLLVRLMLSIVIALFFIDFSDMRSGKSLSETNYLLSKAIISICVLLVFEYIFRIHLWYIKEPIKPKRIIGPLVFHMLAGVIFLHLLAWFIVTKVLGLNYLNYWEAMATNSKTGVAMIWETLVILNCLILGCYMYHFSFIRYLAVAYLNNVKEIRIEDVWVINRFEELNYIFLNDAKFYVMIDQRPLSELFKDIEPGGFDFKDPNVLFNKSFFNDGEANIRKIVEEFLNPDGQFLDAHFFD